MKSRIIIFAMAAVALLTVGCQKENGDGLRLIAEGYNNGTKVAVDGNTSTWVDGDMVLINGKEASVSVSGSNATVNLGEGNGVDAPFYGVYPAGIYTSNSGASYTLTLPASYTYSASAGVQHLASPMVGYTENSTSMTFKHLTAAVTVQVTNDFGIDVRVTDITVSSNKYKLNGATTVTLGSGDASVDPVEEASDAAKRQVQMTFGGDQLVINSGSSASVQVPVLPVGSANSFTISVTVQNKDDAEMQYTFSKTQGTSQGTYALSRAQLGYAPAKFGGVFSVAADKQVRFAPGNLQYQASTGTWRFAKHQYDAIGNAAGNNVFTDARATQSEWIDLFGWGTSGWDNGNSNYLPYNNYYTSSSYAYGYGPKSGYNYNLDLTGDYKESDWGYHNAISNGGNTTHIWRTMTSGSGNEYDYLLNTRNAATVNAMENARYAKGKVNNIQGLILFPDDYVHPDGVTQPAGINSTSSEGWYGNNYDATSWGKMEVAGAIFLPVTGRTENASVANAGYGYYWSASYYTNSGKYNAYQLYFASGQANPSNYIYRYYGCAVRLVRDVE